jgi:hypothetical protein
LRARKQPLKRRANTIETGIFAAAIIEMDQSAAAERRGAPHRVHDHSSSIGTFR